METSEDNLNNLMRWMETLIPMENSLTQEALCTGRPIAKTLMNIDNEYFTENWYSKTFEETSTFDELSLNWRIKALILKKILKSMTDYYASISHRHIPDSHMPDLQAAARDSSRGDLFKMLQILVAIAVNCPNRASIIANISSLDPSVQSSVMLAIQELEEERSHFDQILNYDEEVRTLQVEIARLREENEKLTNKCEEQETKIVQIDDEKKTLIEETQRLKSNQSTDSRLPDETDFEEVNKKVAILQRRLDDAEEEIFRVERARDEINAKLENVLRENKDLHTKLDSVSIKDEEVQKMKDELEELRIKSVEFKKMEATLETYRRKLDESNQLRNELKILQDKNAVFMNCAIDLEEEKRRSSAFKTQMDAYKRQLDEQEARQSGLGSDSVYQQENERLKDELKTLISDRERAANEKHSAKDFKEEMRVLENADPKENKIESLESRLRSKDLELLTTEEKFKTALHAKDMELRSVEDRYKTAQQSKENEMLALEEKYKSYLAKAKTVIVELEKTQSSGSTNGNTYGRVEFEGLRKELEDKDKLIQKLQEDQERMRIMKEQEDRLITTAFHGMAMQLHRNASEKRLTSYKTNEASSLLSRQREITANNQRLTAKNDQSSASKSSVPFR